MIGRTWPQRSIHVGTNDIAHVWGRCSVHRILSMHLNLRDVWSLLFQAPKPTQIRQAREWRLWQGSCSWRLVDVRLRGHGHPLALHLFQLNWPCVEDQLSRKHSSRWCSGKRPQRLLLRLPVFFIVQSRQSSIKKACLYLHRMFLNALGMCYSFLQLLLLSWSWFRWLEVKLLFQQRLARPPQKSVIAAACYNVAIVVDMR